jgi:hypothetical protein
MRSPTYTELRDRVGEMGHRFFTGTHNPNIIGVRNRSRQAGAWDDLLILAYEDQDGHGVLRPCQGTTDPGVPYLETQRVPIVVPGQHRSCWSVGPEYLHRGAYPCFKHNGNPITCVWDDDLDDQLDIESAIAAGKTFPGVKGINGHRAHADEEVSTVGRYSSACQVWLRKNAYREVLGFVTATIPVWGYRVTYTLLDQWIDA